MNAPQYYHINRKAREKWMRWWTHFWMRFAGFSTFGRIATRLAVLFAPPHKAQVKLAKLNRKGFVSPSAQIHHSDLQLGINVYIGDRVVIYQAHDGGSIKLGNRVSILRDTIMETGYGGSLTIGAEAYIHPRCQFNAHKASIHIGRGVMIAANCVFYPHNHGTALDQPIRKQPLETKGDIIIGNEAWLGSGVIILGGVRIGDGAVIGAGAVVTSDVPDGAIAVGVPARVVKMRSEIAMNGHEIPPEVMPPT